MVDNPSAFPFPEVRDHEGCGLMEGSTGMSLRDWFAGQVANSLIPPAFLEAANRDVASKFAYQTAAMMAYKMADAMLAARKEPGA